MSAILPLHIRVLLAGLVDNVALDRKKIVIDSASGHISAAPTITEKGDHAVSLVGAKHTMFFNVGDRMYHAALKSSFLPKLDLPASPPSPSSRHCSITYQFPPFPLLSTLFSPDSTRTTIARPCRYD